MRQSPLESQTRVRGGVGAPRTGGGVRTEGPQEDFTDVGGLL